jgi:LuxR family maltose regulon positive regulatory protein
VTLFVPSVSGQEMLEYLERANLFIVHLDNERRWYRYHHLFADFTAPEVHLLDDCVVTQFEKRCASLRKQYNRLGITLMSRQAFLHSLEHAPKPVQNV